MKYWPLFFLAVLTLGACNLEQEIELDLPEYEPQLVVEAYVEPGQPFRALLTLSASYFDPFPSDPEQYFSDLLVDGAEVTITHKGQEYELVNGVFFDFLTGKLYNYQSVETAPADYGGDVFELDIVTVDGKTVEGTTRLLPVVPIDSVVVEFQDTLAWALTYFQDDVATENFYRRMIHQNSLDSLALQDFFVSDRLAENGQVLFGTGYQFAEGDTIINTLFHIDRDYYNFLESIANAIASNGNPFGQPGVIVSNLSGTANAIGIFTALSYDRVITIATR